MHSEDPEIQDLSIECFVRLENEFPEPPELNEKLRGSREYAEKHARIIGRFGRYPHRNKILGRESTEEEKTISYWSRLFFLSVSILPNFQSCV